MQNLVPHFILENYAAGVYSGQMQVASIFVDISGFSAITNTLAQHGSEAAEVMANAMCCIFEPLVDAVYARNGFITTFAGDGFTALFPQQENQPEQMDIRARLNALSAALAIQAHMVAHPVQETTYGRFPFVVKLGLGEGLVSWGILQPETSGVKAAYYFSGPGVEAAAASEHHAQPGNIILCREFADALADQVKTLPVGEDGFVRLLALGANIALPALAELESVQTWPWEDIFVPEAILQRDRRRDLQDGEFRQVVSVFINLMGIHDPQDLEPFMQAVFTLQRQYGGYLARVDFGDKGCNLLLFWGTPTGTEQDVESALYFTLALGEHTPGSYKAGITYTMLYAGLAGSIRRGEWTCYGDGLNFAARLMVAAPWGSIWLDERMAHRAGGQFVVEKVGARSFKGFAEPQPVHALLEQSAAQVGDFFQGSMVGRQAELAQMHAFIRPLCAPLGEKRFAGLLVIEGDAGLGKSRLVVEFLRSLDCSSPSSGDAGEAEGSIRYALCQADPTVREPLNPFRYWLRSYFGQSSSESVARNKRAFGRIFDQLVADLLDQNLQQELNRGRSFLGAMVDLYWDNSPYAELDPPGRYELTFTALKAFILAESLRQPLILTIEDAHCLDEDSLAFLSRLVRHVDAYPLAILATARPHVEQTPLFGSLSYQHLELEPLESEEIFDLARDLLGGPPDESLAALLEARAEGNPFFAEQILLYLREGGLLTQVEDAWHLSGQQAQEVLPDDVRTVFTARLDRLTVEVKEMVQAAAVLGREFEVQVLSLMLQEDPLLPEKLQQAEGESIWRAISAMRYLFRQGLLRDAAYEMQLLSQRRELHRLAAKALEELYAQDLAPHYGEIAYHYEIAFQQGLDAARQPACRYLALAGQQSAAAYENAAALDLYNRALALLQDNEDQQRYSLLLAREQVLHLMGERAAQAADLQTLYALAQDWQRPAERAEVHLRQARYFSATGDYTAAIEQAHLAVQSSQAAGQMGQEAAARLACGEALWRQGSYLESEACLEQALALASAAAQPEMEARILYNLGNVAFRQSAYDRARQHYEHSLALAQALEHPAQQAPALLGLGNVALYLGEYPAARHFYEQSLALSRQVGDRMAVGRALNNLGLAAHRQGDYDAARGYYAQGLAIARQVGDLSVECMLLSNLGDVASDQGDYVTAQQDYSRSLELAQQLGNRQSEGIGLGSLGTVAHRSGDLALACKYLEDSLAIFGQLGNRWAEAVGLNYLGAIDLSRGDVCAAQAHYAQSLELALQLNDRQNQSRALDGLGRAAFQKDGVEAACGYYRQSLDLARQVGDRDGEGKTLHNLGRAELALGRVEAAQEAFEAALALRQQLHQPQHTVEDLTGLAQSAWQCGDMAQARSRLEAALTILADSPALEGAENPSWVFLSLVRLLFALADGRAASLLAQAQARLQAQAARLPDDAARRMLAEEIPENRELLAESVPLRAAALPGAFRAPGTPFEAAPALGSDPSGNGRAAELHPERAPDAVPAPGGVSSLTPPLPAPSGARLRRRTPHSAQGARSAPSRRVAQDGKTTPRPASHGKAAVQIASLDANDLASQLEGILASVQGQPGAVIVIHIEQVTIENVHLSGRSETGDE